jgi:hypothetical protein
MVRNIQVVRAYKYFQQEMSRFRIWAIDCQSNLMVLLALVAEVAAVAVHSQMLKSTLQIESTQTSRCEKDRA